MGMTLGAAAVSSVSNSAGSPVTVTYNGLTAGRGLVCAVMVHDSIGTSNSVDSISDGTTSFTLLGTYTFNDTLNWGLQIGYLPAQVAGGNKTITGAFTSGDGGTAGAVIICAEVYDSVTGGIAVDGTGNAQGSSADPTVNVTTGTANSAILAFVAPFSFPTGGSGYTVLKAVNWFLFETSEYDLDVGAAGTYAAGWTAAAAQWVIAAAGFKAAGGAGPAQHDPFTKVLFKAA